MTKLKMLIALTYISFAISGCANKPTVVKPNPLTTNAPFDLTAFKPYAEKGTAKIHGQAFLKTAGGDVKVAAGNDIELVPATAFMKEVRRIKDQGHPVSNFTVEMLEQIKPYIRHVIGDAQGGFVFTDVAPGEYLLETTLTWQVPSYHGLRNTGGLISMLVTVSQGEQKRVMLTEVVE